MKTLDDIATDVRERTEHLRAEAARLRRIADGFDAEAVVLGGVLDKLTPDGSDLPVGVAKHGAKKGQKVEVAVNGTADTESLTAAAKAAEQTAKRGRPKGTGQRDKDVMSVLGAPGRPLLSVAEIADRVGIKPNYLYRVLPRLAEEGKVEKVGQAWRLAR